MSDSDDLERLRSGERDLSSCDFSNADISFEILDNRIFSFSNFTGCRANQAHFTKSNFNGAVLHLADFSNTIALGAIFERANCTLTNFRDADLRIASFKGTGINQTDFSNANLCGANFSNSIFVENVKFDGTLVDETTLFDNAKVMRPLSRHKVFRYYKLVNGTLRRKTDEEIETISDKPTASTEIQIESTRTTSPKEDERAGEAIRQRISKQPVEIQNMARIFSFVIFDEIQRLDSEKPNDTDRLDQHNRYRGFLTTVADNLQKIAASVESAQSESESKKKEENISQASSFVISLQKELNDWVDENSKMITDGGCRIGLIGAACAFLVLCGAPAVGALAISAAIFGGKKPSDVIDLFRKKNG